MMLCGCPRQSVTAHGSGGATHGWLGSRIFSVGGISRRAGVRHCRLCHGLRGVRHLAAHPHADPDHNTDRRLRSLDAGLRRLEIAAHTELATGGAVHHRRRHRRADRNDAPHLYQSGLSGLIVTIWSQLRGWPKDVQRTVFQPVMLAAIVMNAVTLSFDGAATTETAKLYVLGLPALLAGLWSGFKLYGKLDDAAFRKMILLLLLVSGLALIVPMSIFRSAA